MPPLSELAPRELPSSLHASPCLRQQLHLAVSPVAEQPKTATSKCAHHGISASSLFLPGKCHGLQGHSSG